MEVKIRLQWFNKNSRYCEGKEFSADLKNEGSIIDKLGLPSDESIYDGVFNVKREWVNYIQPYFQHQININLYNYQLAFWYNSLLTD